MTVALAYWWRQSFNEEASRSTTSAGMTRPLLALSRSTGSTVSEVVGPPGASSRRFRRFVIEYVLPRDMGVQWEPNVPEASFTVNDEGVAKLLLCAHPDDDDQSRVPAFLRTFGAPAPSVGETAEKCHVVNARRTFRPCSNACNGGGTDALRAGLR